MLKVTKKNILNAAKWVLEHLDELPPPPTQGRGGSLWVEEVEKWLQSLPPQAQLGLLAIYHDFWGTGHWHKFASKNWLKNFRYHLKNTYTHPSYFTIAYETLKSNKWGIVMVSQIKRRLEEETLHEEEENFVNCPIQR